MKRTFLLLVISLFPLQSCTINSEIVYHKDASSSMLTDIDMREFIKEMKAMTPDSLQNKKEFEDMDKLPTTWTSIYELEKKEGKTTKGADSIRIMKKIFMKSAKENNQPAGFSLKLDHFSQSDYKTLDLLTKQEKLPLEQNIYNIWDGKTLTIDTDNFNLKSLQEILSKQSPDGQSEDGSDGKTEGMMMMFFKKVETTLKFEGKIKSITGKHDWLKQVDDHSLKIDYDLKTMFDKDAKLTNADKKIIIVTE